MNEQEVVIREVEVMVIPAFIEKRGEYLPVTVRVEDILYIEVFREKHYIHTKTERYVLPFKFAQYDLFEGFSKVDRSFIVRMSQVKHYDDFYNQLHFDNYKKVNIAPKYVTKFKEVLKSLLRK